MVGESDAKKKDGMRNALDFSSWSAVLSTLMGLVLVSLVAVGVRLVFMQTLQRRRERENRQINERLKTLIAAYKTLGGSFTGNLEVDPSHLRDTRRRAQEAAAREAEDERAEGSSDTGSERRRRIRDAVEAALSDVILLGTQEQVRLAAQAANDMVAGRTVHVAPLVASLRAFIRDALDLEEIPADLRIPAQGPLRTASSTAGSGRRAGGGAEGAGGAGRGGGGAQGAGGMGMGIGAVGLHHAAGSDADAPPAS